MDDDNNYIDETNDWLPLHIRDALQQIAEQMPEQAAIIERRLKSDTEWDRGYEMGRRHGYEMGLEDAAALYESGRWYPAEPKKYEDGDLADAIRAKKYA